MFVCLPQIRRRRPTPATLQIYRQPGTGKTAGREKEGNEGGEEGEIGRELKSSSYNGTFIRFVLQLLVSDLNVQTDLMDV